MTDAVKKPHELLADGLRRLFEVADHALSTGEMIPSEQAHLHRSEADLRVFGSHLIRLIKAFEDDGKFGEAYALQRAIWGSVVSSASIGQFAATTESAKHFFLEEIRLTADAARAEAFSKREKKQLEALRDYIETLKTRDGEDVVRQELSKPSKFVESHLDRLNDAARAAGAQEAGRSTWIDRLAASGFPGIKQNPATGKSNKKSNPATGKVN